MSLTNAKSSHHHGSLREALIVAGLELLENGGPAALTLRKCAALAGVSHAAPANHFSGLISLKVAMAARGHLIFAKTMRKYSANAEPTPEAQLNAICTGYIAFAQDHRELFQFMFQFFDVTAQDIDDTSMNEKRQAASASYEILREVCLPFEHNDNNALNTETMVWSLVHGYAMLFTGKGRDAHLQPQQSIPLFAEILPKLTIRQDPKP